MSSRISKWELKNTEVGKTMPTLDYCQALAALRRTGLVGVNIGSSCVWRQLQAIRAIAMTPDNVVDAGWLADQAYHEKYSGKPNIQNESTYDNCVDLDLNLKTCLFQVTMWNGYSLDGSRLDRRCWWHVKADDPNDPRIEEAFTSIFVDRLLSHATTLWHDAEVERQQREMFAIYKQLIT